MLFPRNALASGPQAGFGAEKGLFKEKVGMFSSIPLLPLADLAAQFFPGLEGSPGKTASRVCDINVGRLDKGRYFSYNLVAL